MSIIQLGTEQCQKSWFGRAPLVYGQLDERQLALLLGRDPTLDEYTDMCTWIAVQGTLCVAFIIHGLHMLHEALPKVGLVRPSECSINKAASWQPERSRNYNSPTRKPALDPDVECGSFSIQSRRETWRGCGLRQVTKIFMSTCSSAPMMQQTNALMHFHTARKDKKSNQSNSLLCTHGNRSSVPGSWNGAFLPASSKFKSKTTVRIPEDFLHAFSDAAMGLAAWKV